MPLVNEYIRGLGRLVAIQEVPVLPVKPVVDYIFEEVTAEMQMMVNGIKVDDLGTLWDHGGLEDSVVSAIEEAKRFVKAYKLTRKSDAEIIVVRVVTQTRKRPNRECENLYDKTVQHFEHLTTGSHWNVPDPVRTVVWSSKFNGPPPATKNKS